MPHPTERLARIESLVDQLRREASDEDVEVAAIELLFVGVGALYNIAKSLHAIASSGPTFRRS